MSWLFNIATLLLSRPVLRETKLKIGSKTSPKTAKARKSHYEPRFKINQDVFKPTALR
jgi:hypothetical protein